MAVKAETKTEEIKTEETPTASTASAVVDLPIESRKIPLLTIVGKAIDVSEFGYKFENVHIRKDVPLNVLAMAFSERLGTSEKSDLIKQEFFEAESIINLYCLEKKRLRVRSLNGMINYGTEVFPIPGVGPEVLLKIIEDKMKESEFRSSFEGVMSVQFARAINGVKATLKLLA